MGHLFILAIGPILLLALAVAMVAMVFSGLMKLAIVAAVLWAITLVVALIVLRKKGALEALKASPKRWQQLCGKAIPVVLIACIVGCAVFVVATGAASMLLDQWLATLE